MKFADTRIAGAVRIDIEPHRDDRGFFARTYCIQEFRDVGIDKPLIQNSISVNNRAGTLRGMHYHAAEFPQTRLFRCITGRVFAAFVDLRVDSLSYLQNDSFELSQQNQTSLFLPAGVALGYQTLEDDSTVYYQMSELYDPKYERGVRWNDPAFDIQWPDAERTIIERDANYPDYVSDTGVK